MSTVLHPAGPEPAQTYWKRRVVVIAVAVVVLAITGALIANGTSSGSAVQASPSPPPPAVTAVVTGSPSPKPSAGARSSAGATPAKATPSASASATASARPSATPSATPKPSKTPTPEPVACAPDTLRPTLTGKQRLKPKERNTFTLSLINGSGQTCSASVSPDNFELRIYSGSDRIWSTKDCATLVKPVRRTLEAEQALEWKLAWNGLRSRAGCKPRPEIPRPGTYYATAQLTGAEPVQLLMTLRG
jgi:hypothetical protein